MLPIGTKARLVAVLNPWVRHYRRKVVTVERVPSSAPGYDADVKARDGKLLAVNWTQLQPLK